MNTSDYSSTTDMTTVSVVSNTRHSKTHNRGEIQQLIVVSTLWILSIITLSVMTARTDDIRIALLLVIALLIGLPIMVWTYVTLTKGKDRHAN